MRKPVPFGKYLLLDRIAVGGMAEVFAAKTFGVEGFERLLAIKRILPTMVEDEEFITMFVDEARIASMLQHANLVHIFDLGKHDDTFYIAMEYISGRDVRLIIDKFRKQKKVMPVAMACFIMARMAEGLDYAHRKADNQGNPLGIIHRDISPQNVLVSYDGDVKVIDFGIAKAAGRLQQTQAGILKGKFGYMSPEQVRGLPIDHRSDIYSAGVMFYEMLTGTKLFTGESDFSTLEKVRAGEVPSPSEINPLVTPQLERIILKALAKERDERYQWPGELHEDLTRFLYSRDEIFSSKVLGEFMKEAFQTEVNKEQERMTRWWATTPEETTDFDLSSSTPPPAQAVAGAQVAPDGKVRIGPPSAFMTEELRLEDRTSIAAPFDGAHPPESGEAVAHDQATVVRDPNAPAPEPRPRRTSPSRPRRSTGEFNKTLPAGTADRAAHEAARMAEVNRGLPPPSVPLTPKRKSALLPVVATLVFFALAASGGVFAWRQLKAPTLGAYIINVNPHEGFTVRIDGKVPPPDMLPSGRLALGQHSLTVEAPGYEPYAADFTLGSKPLVVNVKLEKLVEEEPAADAGTPEEAVAENAKDTEEAKKREKKRNPEPVVAKERVEKVKEPDVQKVAVSAPGTLVIHTLPGGAMVTINGRAYGKSPVRAEKLPSDEPVKVTVELDGYHPLTRMKQVPPGRSETLRLNMEKLPTGPVVIANVGDTATIKLATQDGKKEDDSAPAAAAEKAKISASCMPVAFLTVDGKRTRYTPISKANPIEVAPGKHVLGCEAADGRRGATLDVILEPGQSFTFRGKL